VSGALLVGAVVVLALLGAGAGWALVEMRRAAHVIDTTPPVPPPVRVSTLALRLNLLPNGTGGRWRWTVFDAEPDYQSSRVEGVLVPYALDDRGELTRTNALLAGWRAVEQLAEGAGLGAGTPRPEPGPARVPDSASYVYELHRPTGE